MQRIDSAENKHYKYLKALSKGNAPKKYGVVLCEGLRLVTQLLEQGQAIVELILPATGGGEALALDCLRRFALDPEQILFLPDHLLARLGQTQHTQAVFAVVPCPDLGVEPELKAGERWLYAEEVQDPGNLGTMLRTVEAFGFSGLLLGPASVSPFNEKVIRASLGAAFKLRLAEIASPTRLRALTNLPLIIGDLAGTPLQALDRRLLAGGFVLLIGNEARGVSAEARALADLRLRIEMRGAAESLNAAVAAGILAYHLQF